MQEIERDSSLYRDGSTDPTSVDHDACENHTDHILSVKNALPVLTYIAMHPGCIQEDVRKATIRNNGTLRKVLNTLIDIGMVREVNCRNKDYTALTTYLYASPLAVNISFSYGLVLQCLAGQLDSNDPTFDLLMQERFDGAYQRALKSARNIPKSDS